MEPSRNELLAAVSQTIERMHNVCSFALFTREKDEEGAYRSDMIAEGDPEMIAQSLAIVLQQNPVLMVFLIISMEENKLRLDREESIDLRRILEGE